MNSWREVTLGELCTLRAGSAFKLHYQGGSEGEFPFIKVSDMNHAENGIRIQRANNWISEEVRAKIGAQPIPAGATVFAKIGEALKQNRVRFLVRDTIVDNNMMGAIPKRDVIDPMFLFYCLSDFDFGATSIGTALPYLRVSTLSAAQFQIPPLRDQRRIVGMLWAYDEWSENNQRRIQILEEMVRELYREWFVEFRFPGHREIKFVESSLGQIPKGWSVKKLSEIAEINRAQINARNAPDELRYIDISSVSPGQIDSITTYTFADAPGRARRIVAHGDVLWSCVRPNRRSHALVMFPEPNTIASTGFAVLTAKTVPYTFLYAVTTTEDFVGYLTNNASGAAYPAVTASTFEKAAVIFPPPTLLKRFGDVTVPMAEEAHFLRQQVTTLRKTRDLLLPTLLTGRHEAGD